MNPHNQPGRCSNWRFVLVKATSRRRLLERQEETLEKHNPAKPLGVTHRHSSNTSGTRCKLEVSRANQPSGGEKLPVSTL